MRCPEALGHGAEKLGVGVFSHADHRLVSIGLHQIGRDGVPVSACVAISMLEQIEGSIARFTANGAYDSRPMYEVLAASSVANIKIVIPSMKTATVDARATRPWCHAMRPSKRSAQSVDVNGARNGMYRYIRIRGSPTSQAPRVPEKRGADCRQCP